MKVGGQILWNVTPICETSQMTKDTGEQYYAVACREYTVPRENGSSQPRGWIQGNTKIGPVMEVTTSCLHGKHGVEIKNYGL